MVSRSRTRTALGGVLVAALIASACGSSDTQPAASVPEQPTSAVTATPTPSTPAAESEPAQTPEDRPEPVAAAPGFVDGSGNTITFRDVTVQANANVAHASPFDAKKDGAEMMGGAAVGDFNNDGWQDLYFIGGGINADALFINNGDGTFDDMAETAGLTEKFVGAGATVGDFDGDGWLDIFVTSHGTAEEGQIPGTHRLYRNNGDLTFTNVATQAGVNQTSPRVSDGFGAAFGDYDLDGDLDLFVAGWVRNGRGNRLFRNEGDGTFTDVTEEAGIVDDNIRGFSPCIIDTDGDRYPEILLVADFGSTRYWQNMGDGTFTDRTEHATRGVIWSGMGTAVGDFNRDGLVDWYTTEILDDEDSGRGSGNKLFLNQGDHLYDEVAATTGVDDGGWGWGAVAVDLNLDGMLDLVEVNGWRLPAYDGEMAKVWIQQSGMTFEEVADVAGLRHELFGLSVIDFDFDNDGDRDIAITAGNDRFELYETQLDGAEANWLRVELDTSSRPNLAPNGIGARVRVEVGDEAWYDDVVGCSNYLSSSELSAHFGLGAIEAVDRVVVDWPDGSSTVVDDVELNATLRVAAEG